MQTCSFTGIHLDDKIQKQKNVKCFFAFCLRQNDCKRGFAIVQIGLDDKMQKNKSVAMRRNWRRNETLNLMQLGEIAM